MQDSDGSVQKAQQSRWIIPAKQSTQLEVVLQASALGMYHHNLDFEVSDLLLTLLACQMRLSAFELHDGCPGSSQRCESLHAPEVANPLKIESEEAPDTLCQLNCDFEKDCTSWHLQSLGSWPL